MSDVAFLSCPGNDDFVARCVGAGSPRVVSLVGAGGKTSTLFWLSKVLAARGQRVLVTTTTRMLLPDPTLVSTMVIEPDFDRRVAALRRLPNMAGIVALFSAYAASENKVFGCLPAEIDALQAAAVADAILVEADGARHCALKAPAAHEPCVSSTSHVVIALTGGAALGRPANPAGIHRWPQFAAVTGLAAGDPVGEQAMGRMLAHAEGMFKNAPAHARRHWLVNMSGALDPSVLSMLSVLAGRHAELDGLWVGDMRQGNPFSHAWVRD